MYMNTHTYTNVLDLFGEHAPESYSFGVSMLSQLQHSQFRFFLSFFYNFIKDEYKKYRQINFHSGVYFFQNKKYQRSMRRRA